MVLRSIHRLFVLGVGLVLATSAMAQEIVATPQKASGVYEIGEKIQWRVEVKGEGAAGLREVSYVLKKGGRTVMREGKLDLSVGPGMIEASLDEPGTILAEIKETKAPVEGKKPIRGLAGAVVAPEKIKPSAERPADFDAFWQSKIEELNAVPMEAVLEPGESGRPKVEYAKIRMDNIRGTHIYGQIAKPKREGKFPAMLLVQYAGVYGLPKSNVVSKAEGGWLALNIMAHDMPLDETGEFYKKAQQTTVRDYCGIGNNDREKSYFLRMYLSCYRAVEYLSQRPDWDGRTLVVVGTSQGGQQALVTAGLNPKVTAVMACVPAGCDTMAFYAGRAFGYPYWYSYTHGRDEKKIMETSRYFDVVNFASRIKCPALVALGLIDETCPPVGVLSACNQLQGPKEVLIMPNADHGGQKNSHAKYGERLGAWCKEMLEGREPPAK